MTPESLQMCTRVFEEELNLETSVYGRPRQNPHPGIEGVQERRGSIVWLENHMSALRNNERKLIGIIALSPTSPSKRRRWS